MSDFDFSCIPCAGQVCFPKQLGERRACTRNGHACPYRPDNRDWRCRCCEACTARCQEQAQLLKEAHAR